MTAANCSRLRRRRLSCLWLLVRVGTAPGDGAHCRRFTLAQRWDDGMDDSVERATEQAGDVSSTLASRSARSLVVCLVRGPGMCPCVPVSGLGGRFPVPYLVPACTPPEPAGKAISRWDSELLIGPCTTEEPLLPQPSGPLHAIPQAA